MLGDIPRRTRRPVISVVAAALVVTRRNPVFSAIWLVAFFVTISLDFLILRAPFLAVIQVLVYAGAIMVLFLFVIMLLNLQPEELKETVTVRRKAGAGILSGAIFLLLCVAISRSPSVERAASLTAPLPAGSQYADAGETSAIGYSLVSRHVLAFEVSSVLVLIAIIGAIYLTKKRRPAMPQDTASTSASLPAGAPAPVPVEDKSGSREVASLEPVGARHA